MIVAFSIILTCHFWLASTMSGGLFTSSLIEALAVGNGGMITFRRAGSQEQLGFRPKVGIFDRKFWNTVLAQVTLVLEFLAQLFPGSGSYLYASPYKKSRQISTPLILSTS